MCDLPNLSVESEISWVTLQGLSYSVRKLINSVKAYYGLCILSQISMSVKLQHILKRNSVLL